MSTVSETGVDAVAEVVDRFNAAWNDHDLAAAIALTSEDCVFEATSPAPDGQRCAGHAALRAAWQPIFDDVTSQFTVNESSTVKWLVTSSKIGCQAARSASWPTQRWPSGAGDVASNTQSSLVRAIAAARSWLFHAALKRSITSAVAATSASLTVLMPFPPLTAAYTYLSIGQSLTYW